MTLISPVARALPSDATARLGKVAHERFVRVEISLTNCRRIEGWRRGWLRRGGARGRRLDERVVRSCGRAHARAVRARRALLLRIDSTRRDSAGPTLSELTAPGYSFMCVSSADTPGISFISAGECRPPSASSPIRYICKWPLRLLRVPYLIPAPMPSQALSDEMAAQWTCAHDSRVATGTMLAWRSRLHSWNLRTRTSVNWPRFSGESVSGLITLALGYEGGRRLAGGRVEVCPERASERANSHLPSGPVVLLWRRLPGHYHAAVRRSSEEHGPPVVRRVLGASVGADVGVKH